MIHLTLFCVWLIPAEPYYSSLMSKIQELSITFEAPAFIPHLTLFCGKTSNISQVKNDLNHLLSRQTPLVLSSTVIDFTDEYYRTLFLKFKADKVVSKMNAALKNVLDHNSLYQFSPHLSFLYQNLPLSEKQRLSRVTENDLNQKGMTNNKMTFDQVFLMSDIEEIGPEAVKSWKALASWKLK